MGGRWRGGCRDGGGRVARESESGKGEEEERVGWGGGWCDGKFFDCSFGRTKLIVWGVGWKAEEKIDSLRSWNYRTPMLWLPFIDSGEAKIGLDCSALSEVRSKKIQFRACLRALLAGSSATLSYASSPLSAQPLPPWMFIYLTSWSWFANQVMPLQIFDRWCALLIWRRLNQSVEVSTLSFVMQGQFLMNDTSIW